MEEICVDICTELLRVLIRCDIMRLSGFIGCFILGLNNFLLWNLVNKVNLKCVLFCFAVPIFKLFSFLEVKLDVGNFESYRFIRFRRQNEVLKFLVRFFYPLFKTRHNSVSRSNFWFNLRQINLKKETFLLGFRVFLLENFVPGYSNFLKLFFGHFWLGHLLSQSRVFLFSELASMELGLVLFAGSMRQIGILSRVERQTKSTLERAQMIPHNVRVIFDVKSFIGKLPDSISTSSIQSWLVGLLASARLRTNAILKIHKF